MRNRKIIALASVLIAQNALSMTQCPTDFEMKCGPNPYYALILGLTKVCSDVEPSKAKAAQYQAALEQMVSENPDAYAKLEAQQEFVSTRNQYVEHLQTLKFEELQKQCKTLLN
jgi:hypothetical protein